MAALTRDAIERVLGPTDDDVAAALVATGATEEELREAHAWLTSDEAMINEFRSLPKGRAAEVADLLARLDEAAMDEEG